MFNEDKPYALPAAITLAERCDARAWDNDTDDDSRMLLEQAAEMIRELMGRCVSLAAAGERLEAERVKS
jgi:hypothetical protein